MQWKKINCANPRQKKGLDVLISKKIDFRTMKVIRNKEEHYRIMSQLF